MIVFYKLINECMPGYCIFTSSALTNGYGVIWNKIGPANKTIVNNILNSSTNDQMLKTNVKNAGYELDWF